MKKTLSIKGKILLIVYTSLIGIALITGITFYLNHERNQLAEQEETISLLVDESTNLKYLVSEVRKNEQTFLKLPTDDAEKATLDSLTELENATDSFLKAPYLSNKSKSLLEEIKSETENYLKEFKVLASKHRVVGFSGNNGLRDQLSRSEETYKKFLKEYGGNELLIPYLELSNLQNQYMLERKNEFYDSFNQRYESYENLIKSSRLSVYDKDLLSRRMRSHHILFTNIKTVYDEIETLNKEFEKTAKNVENISASLKIDLNQTKNAIVEEGNEFQNWMSSFLLSVIIIISLVVFLISLLSIRSIISSIERLKNGAEIIGKGDLTHQVHIEQLDEMGQLSLHFNDMANRLNEIVTKMSKHSNRLHESSHTLSAHSEETTAKSNEVLEAMKQINKGSVKQAEKLKNATSLLKSNSEKISNVKEKSHFIKKEFDTIKMEGDDGKKAIASLVETTDSLFEFIDSFLALVHTSVEKTSEIQKITKIIEDVSKKTNLLALNAAIEAKSSGAVGSGFEVVAAEVKKLSDTSKKEVLTIQNLVGEIETSIKELIAHSSMFDSVKEQQSYSVKKANEVFTTIDSNVNQTNVLFSDILNDILAVHESNTKVDDSISYIATISQDFVVAAEQTVQSNEEQKESIEKINDIAVNLSEISNELNKETQFFQIKKKQ